MFSVAVEPEMKRRRFALDPAKVSSAVSEAAAAASTSTPDDGHRFIEQFNADMMQQFLAHQVRDTESDLFFHHILKVRNRKGTSS